MSFSQQDFKYIKLVKHQGSFFSFVAIPQETTDKNGHNITYLELYFNYLDPTKAHINDISQEKLAVGDELWTSYQKLDFPTEYVYAGSSLINYKITGYDEETKQRHTTSVNTIDAPFQVISDGQYIYIFRSTRSNQIYVDRFVFDNATKQLKNKREIRFIRSQNKDVPLDSKDTFGSKNLNNQEFIEPTTQLNLKYEVENGNFTVQILPSSEFKTQENWHLFTLSADGAKVNAYCIPRCFDGLFDLSKMVLTTEEGVDGFRDVVTPYSDFNLRKDGNILTGLRFPSSLLYNTQEQIVDTYGNRQYVKRGGRLLMSCVYDKTETINDEEVTNGVKLPVAPKR